MSGTPRTLLIRGGSGSGKTFICMRAILLRAFKFPHTEHYLLKTDLKVLRSSFESSVIAWFKSSGMPASFNSSNVKTWHYDSGKSILTLGNGSRIYLKPIRSPYPSNSGGDSDILGINAETIYLDEATTIRYEWYQFLETRCRSAHGCPPMLIFTENPDAKSWTHAYFDERVDPLTLKKLSTVQREQSKVMRIEAWDNKLQDKLYLEILKNSGNATRFYYGVADDGEDYNQIYRYDVAPFVTKLFNIYAIDPGYSAPTGIVQISFGGSYSVNVRQLCYRKGMLLDDYKEEVQHIINYHTKLYNAILEAIPLGARDKLTKFHETPTILVDCARTDLIDDLNRHFNLTKSDKGTYYMVGKKKVNLVPCNKVGTKAEAIERVRIFRQIVDTTSKFYLSEIRQYRYDDKGNVPDGNDHLLDAALYGMRYLLEMVFTKNANALVFNKLYEQLYELIKNIEVEF